MNMPTDIAQHVVAAGHGCPVAPLGVIGSKRDNKAFSTHHLKPDAYANLIFDMELLFKPLTIDQWDDFVSLFGERGACGGCWCMLWRLTRKQYESQKGIGNKLAMKAIVDSGEVPGMLTYHDTEAIGWCAIAPRSSYSALSRSRILQPIDDRTCWSVACLFIKKSYRKKGVSTELLKAASEYAKKQGAELVEGYPVEPKPDKDIPPAFAWTGIPTAFIRAGFKEVLRRSPTRPIMRKELK